MAGCVAISCFGVSCSPELVSPATALTTDHSEAAGEYVLQDRDRIEVLHILDGKFSATRVLPPDGQITLPGIKQPVKAIGETLPQLHETLDKLYRSAGILSDPFYTLSLSGIANQTVFIGGEVLRPGLFKVTGTGRSIMQAIMARGGPLATAKLNEAVVIRVMPSGDLDLFTVDLGQVLKGTDLAQNIALAPMDIVVLPKTGVARFDVWVDQYIRQAIPVPLSFALQLTAKPFGLPY